VGFSTVTRHVAQVLELAGRMLAAPRFDERDVDRERQRQLAVLLQGPDHPSWLAQRAFRALLYGKTHPYGNPADGFVETVKSLTRDDVVGFHHARFAADRSTLILVGDVEPSAVVETLEKTLTAWRSTGLERAARPAAEPPSDPDVVHIVDKAGAVQSIIDIGRVWIDRKDPRYFATLLGNRVLGGDFLSRLNRNLREEHGYTYGAHSLFLYRRKGSVFAVNTDVRTDATAAAFKEIEKELDGLGSGTLAFTDQEVEVARSAEIRAFPESFEDPAGIAGELQQMAVFDLPADYLDTYLDRLKATSTKDVQHAMTEVVDPAQRVRLIVGDRNAIAPALEKSGVRNIRALTADGKLSAR
jgi:zinc protease